jgi:hypothetical protein
MKRPGKTHKTAMQSTSHERKGGLPDARGLSRGPLTEEGRAKCAAAKTIHGRETRQKRAYRSTKMAELYELEMLGRKIGLISGPKTAGRKPGK